jgi:signal transduction histidine kinase
MPLRKLEKDLSIALAESRFAQNRAGRDLHDKVIPQLTATGMHLQLLCMDHPETAEAVGQALSAMDLAMDEIRRLSGTLAPSPVYRLGLGTALRKLVEERQSAFAGKIKFAFTRGTRYSKELDVVLYEIVQSLLQQTLGRRGAKAIQLAVGPRTVRLAVDGHGPVKPFGGVTDALAAIAGFTFQQTARKGTIVFVVRQSGVKTLV